MTKTIGRTTFAAAFAAGLVLAVGPAMGADLAELQTDIENGQVVAALDATETSIKYIPKGGEPTEEFPEREPEIGDAFAFTDDLRQDGELVGTDEGTCTVAPEDAISCEATLALAGGTVTAAGVLVGESATSTVPLTAGTGDYAGIKGTLTIADHSDEDDPTDTLATLTLRYLLPAETTQVGAVPAGGAQTGGGIGDPGASIALFAIAAAAIVTGSGIAGLGRRLRNH